MRRRDSTAIGSRDETERESPAAVGLREWPAVVVERTPPLALFRIASRDDQQMASPACRHEGVSADRCVANQRLLRYEADGSRFVAGDWAKHVRVRATKAVAVTSEARTRPRLERSYTPNRRPCTRKRSRAHRAMIASCLVFPQGAGEGPMASPKPSEVTIPDDLRQALEATPEAYAAFLVMPPSHRREHLAYIDEAKSPSTRARRIMRALEMMSQWQADRAADRKQSRKITARDRPAVKVDTGVSREAGASDTTASRRKSGKRP